MRLNFYMESRYLKTGIHMALDGPEQTN